LYEALANDFVYADPKRILVFGDNHDMDRLFTQLGKDVSLTKMALTYFLTVRGIPQVFYGTELLAENSDHPNNHGYIRSDFPGGWKDDKVNGFTGAGLSAEQLSVQTYLKQLLNWRKNNSVIADGETLHFAPFDGVYVYFRYSNEKTIMVVMNKNEKEISIETKRFAEILKNKTDAVNVLTGETIAVANSFSVAAKTALVLELK
jgi:glycosidase